MLRLRERFQGFARALGSVAEKELTEADLSGPLEEMVLSLVESDVALEAAEALAAQMRSGLAGTRVARGRGTEEAVAAALRAALGTVLGPPGAAGRFEAGLAGDGPAVVVFAGVNGTGKTTTVAKMASRFRGQGRSVVLASADTYRAGAVEQLKIHGDRLGLRVIAHDYGSDPAAVVTDAVEYARARSLDLVLADTAGRIHTDENLMEQLKKIVRVTKPRAVVFVDDATAGSDALARAREFHGALDVAGSVLTKFDADPKGGCALSIAHVTRKPLLYVGTGQNYGDLQPFDPDWLIGRLLG
jgi:fused signal recognition particle receptor